MHYSLHSPSQEDTGFQIFIPYFKTMGKKVYLGQNSCNTPLFFLDFCFYN